MIKILAVVGSRDFDDYELMVEYLSKLKFTELLSGGAKGADSLAERYAEEFNIPIKVFNADWEKYGRKAGMIRNKLIVEYANEGIAFWDGRSTGTANTIECFKKLKKPCKIVIFKDPFEKTKKILKVEMDKFRKSEKILFKGKYDESKR